MSRLQSEFQRLFRLTADGDIALTDSHGRVSTLAIRIVRGRDWPSVATLLDDLRESLGLPLPAVSVDAKTGFLLWFPLAEPVAADAAARFLAALCRRYLGDIADFDIALLPGADAQLPRIPALSPDNERWSAFIDPTMGAMFVEEGGLDFEPNPDRQADLLAAVKPITSADFIRALATLTADEAASGAPVKHASSAVIGHFADPREFLQAVMNDPSVPLALRIEAAKALLGQARSTTG
ncbi:MAG: hypothetical protein H6R14_2535 [Proteobacteria bacterium]|nr:hypothetical protein [Pseudomonadota bacterium]